MKRAAVLGLSFLTLADAVLAQTPARVRDINLQLDGGTADALSRAEFLEMDGALYKLFFFAFEPSSLRPERSSG